MLLTHSASPQATVSATLGCRALAIRTVLEPAPFAAVVIEPGEGRVCFANRYACTLLGYGPQELLGLPLARLFPPPQLANLLELFVAEPGRGAPGTDTVLVRKNGDHRAVHLVGYRVALLGRPYWVGLVPGGSRANSHDAQLLLASGLFELSHEGVVLCGIDLAIHQVNDTFCQITGHRAADVRGLTPREVLHPDFGGLIVHRDPWQGLNAGQTWQGEVTARRRDGRPFPAWLRVSRLPGGDGIAPQMVTLVYDLTEKRAAEQRIHQLANYDSLTGLPNRLLFNEYLTRALERARRGGARVGLIVMDLDRFKEVNDSLGHTTGNRLLHLVAERLRGCVREHDVVARLGGDEFGVVLETLESPHTAAVVSRTILHALAHPFSLGGAEVSTGASAGICVFPDDGDDLDTLFKNADTAMYQAKAEGRNGYRFYTPELTRATLESFHLERQLRRAIDHGELVLHYQPQALTATGRIVGVEALVRWPHPEEGFIPPSRFIPLAEETGLIDTLGLWVLNSACRQARAWEMSEIGPLRMAVNLSGRQVVDGDIVDTVARVLDVTGLKPALLELEITEGYLIARPQQVTATLKALKALGVAIAMDDFGTGYSSLSYLKHFPLDRLKIDRAFIQDLSHDPDSSAIAMLILSIARSLRMSVVAEGVETRAQLEILKDAGCDEVQGYYLSRPLPAAELEALVIRARRLVPVHSEAVEVWDVLETLN